jgi:hypothetical protein
MPSAASIYQKKKINTVMLGINMKENNRERWAERNRHVRINRENRRI